MILTDDLRGAMQVARPRVIAKPGPCCHDRIAVCPGQITDRWPAAYKVQKIGNDRCHNCLLQHDFRQPYMIGWCQLWPAAAPGQRAAMPVIPVKQGISGKRGHHHAGETGTALSAIQRSRQAEWSAEWSHANRHFDRHCPEPGRLDLMLTMPIFWSRKVQSVLVCSE